MVKTSTLRPSLPNGCPLRSCGDCVLCRPLRTDSEAATHKTICRREMSEKMKKRAREVLPRETCARIRDEFLKSVWKTKLPERISAVLLQSRIESSHVKSVREEEFADRVQFVEGYLKRRDVIIYNVLPRRYMDRIRRLNRGREIHCWVSAKVMRWYSWSPCEKTVIRQGGLSIVLHTHVMQDENVILVRRIVQGDVVREFSEVSPPFAEIDIGGVTVKVCEGREGICENTLASRRRVKKSRNKPKQVMRRLRKNAKKAKRTENKKKGLKYVSKGESSTDLNR